MLDINVLPLLEAFVTIYPNSRFGPAHLVLDDFSIIDSSINFCLDYVRGALNESDVSEAATQMVEHYQSNHSQQELLATRLLLELLLLIPEEVREIVFSDGSYLYGE